MKSQHQCAAMVGNRVGSDADMIAPLINDGSVIPMYPDVTVSLDGAEHGNKGALLFFVSRAAKEAGLRDFELNEFRLECASADYAATIAAVRRWFTTTDEEF